MKKSIKRIVPILLAIMVMILAIPTAFAAEEVFTLGDNVTGILDTDTGVLNVSGTGPMANYSNASDSPLYSYKDTIQQVFMQYGVTSIGENVFYFYTRLESITIPDSVTSIGKNAFCFCSSLESIIIPDSVTGIGESAFSSCFKLTTVSMLGKITSIDEGAFTNCRSLATITIPDSVTSIGEGAFGGCESLKSIRIPESVLTIGKTAFAGCSNLATITIPNSVTSIEDQTFRNCANLTTIIIPESVTSIGMMAFHNCQNLKTLINYCNDEQYIGTFMFMNTGTNLSEKYAYCAITNTTFAAAATKAGYTVRDIDDLPLLTTTTGGGSFEATVPLTGVINATTINITHPVSIEYAVDPNLGYAGGAFVAPDIAITNNSIVPVKVTLKSLSSAAGGTVQFTDVEPGAKDWARLSVADSKSCIALGVQIANSAGWKAGHKADTRYAVETGDTLFGTLNKGSTGHMSMVANYGLSIDQNCTAAHDLVFMFDLA